MFHRVPIRFFVVFSSLLLLIFVGTGFFLLVDTSPPHTQINSSQSYLPLTPTSISSPYLSPGSGAGGVVIPHPAPPGNDWTGPTPTPNPNTPTAPAGCNAKTDPPTAFKTLWPSLTSELSDKYSNLNYSILCLDKWATAWQTPTCTASMLTIFQTLGWPQDLLKDPYGTYIECVAPLTTDQFKTLTTLPQADTNPATPSATTPGNNCTWDLGNWVVVHPQIPICDLVNQMLKGVLAQPVAAAFQFVQHQTPFLQQTPAKLTYENPTLLRFWYISMGIVTILLVAAMSWAALRSMVRSTNWLSYANVVEVVPRLVFGVLAAYATLAASHLIIDASNAFSTIFTNDMLTQATQSTQDNGVAITLQIFYTIMALLLIIEEGVRLVALYILIGFAPLWAFAVCLRETQGIAKGGFRGLILFALLQPAQNAILDLGGTAIKDLTGSTSNYGIFQLLIAVGVMVVVLSLLFTVSRMALSGMVTPLTLLATGGDGILARRASATFIRPFMAAGRSVVGRPVGQFINTTQQRAATLTNRAVNRAAIASTIMVGKGVRSMGNAAITIARAPIEAFRPISPHGPTSMKKKPRKHN